MQSNNKTAPMSEPKDGSQTKAQISQGKNASNPDSKRRNGGRNQAIMSTPSATHRLITHQSSGLSAKKPTVVGRY